VATAEASEFARIVGLEEVGSLAKYYSNRIAEKEIAHAMEAQALRQENTDLKARVEDLVNRLAEATNPPEEPVRESSHAV
jgi:hypothetical protein